MSAAQVQQKGSSPKCILKKYLTFVLVVCKYLGQGKQKRSFDEHRNLQKKQLKKDLTRVNCKCGLGTTTWYGQTSFCSACMRGFSRLFRKFSHRSKWSVLFSLTHIVENSFQMKWVCTFEFTHTTPVSSCFFVATASSSARVTLLHFSVSSTRPTFASSNLHCKIH